MHPEGRATKKGRLRLGLLLRQFESIKTNHEGLELVREAAG